MVNLVERFGEVYVDTDVVVYVLEVRLASQERGDVPEDSSTEVVHADYAIALGEEPLAEVAPDETRPSRNKRPRPSGSGPSHWHSLVRNPGT
jgi:hypothetical protein